MNNRQITLLASILLAVALVMLSLVINVFTSAQAKVTDSNITIVKTADPVVYSGLTANFTIAVTNTSGTTLTGVVVTDPLAPLCNRVIGELTTSASYRYSCLLSGETADYTNSVTVTGILSGVGGVRDTDTAFVDVINPGINIVKTADPTVIQANETAVYTYTVTNPGDDPLNSVEISDNRCSLIDGPNKIFGNADDTLEPGETWQYTCSTALSADTTNTAIVTGTDSLGATVNHSDTASVDVIDPDINIVKTADPTVIQANDTVVYTYAVTNPGDDSLHSVVISDDRCSPIAGPDKIVGNANNNLDPGETWQYTCSTTLSVDTINTVVVTGTNSLGGTVNASDQASVAVIAPAIAIAKTPKLQIVNSGNNVNFTLTVTNTGDVELSDVTVTDDQCDALTGPGGDDGDGVLQTTEVWTYSCAVNHVTDGFINSATVTGEAPAGGVVTASDAAKVILAGAQSCPTDMFAYWKLDESIGSRTFDDFYNGLDAECTPGSCPIPAPGQINNAQSFDGSDELNVPFVPGDDSFNWGVNDSFSIEFWINRPGAPTTNEVAVGRQGLTHPRPHLWTGIAQWAGNVAAFCLFDTAGGGECITGETVVSDGGWHHVVAVRDASSDQILVYVDGRLEGSADYTYTAGFATTTPLNIGWLNYSHGFHYSGMLDEVALYGKALTSSEVKQHYYEVLLAERQYCEASSFAPTIFSTPVTEADVQRPYAYDVDAIGNPPPTYTLNVNPAGMTIDAATGVVSWKPTVAQQGSHLVEVEARNVAGSDVQGYTINVAEGPLCPADMISYWKLDEISGTSYADFYSDHDGACPGGDQCPTPAPGQVGGAQTFTVATNTQIDIPPDAAFDWGVNDSFSMEFWMRRPGTPTNNEVVIGRQGLSHPRPHLWAGVGEVTTANWRAMFCLYDTAGTGGCVNGSTDVTDGNWHHIVASRDASAGQNRIFVDGVLEGSIDRTYLAGFDTVTPLNIGWLNRGAGFHFSGSIDEVALYNRVLSLTEIQGHYTRGVSGYGYCVLPEIIITKEAHATTVYAGEQVTYTYTVTNTGDDVLSSVSVSDDQCSPVTLVQGNVNLGPNETSTHECSVQLDNDTTNLATVQASPTVGDPVSDTATASVNVISPGITIGKQAEPTSIYPGDVVTYTYTVANAGDDPLSNVSVSDDQCSPVILTQGDDNLDNVLDLVETWTYICSIALFTDTLNIATVTGVDSLANTVQDTATAFVSLDLYRVYLPLVLNNPK